MAELPTIPLDYKPSADEDYMSPMQLAYFQAKLRAWKKEILESTQETVEHLKADSLKTPEAMDRISLETETSIELRTRDRMRKLISKIDAALERISTGEYGYCEVTGDEIGLGRLEARPVATMTVEAQEKHERFEKGHIDRDVNLF